MQPTPRTTLFMISSVDGKISSGDTDQLDVDRDWKRIRGVKEGLSQYYDLEQTTDLVSFNTGRVMAKVGINQRKLAQKKIPVSFVLVDNKPHLKKSGLRFLASWLQHVYLVTTNTHHPAFSVQKEVENITVIYVKKIDLQRVFTQLKTRYGIKTMTIQSGGRMNTLLLRAGLINTISLVIAPIVIGGGTTPSLFDGEAIHMPKELQKLKALKLLSVKKLKHSYVHVTYRVIQKTVIKKV